MNVKICTDTDPGLARNNNEDSVAYDAATRLCILADGMGGHNAGEVASGMATAFIKSEMCEQIAKLGHAVKSEEIAQAIEHSVTMANRAIHTMSCANQQYAGMGTTLVVGVFHADNLVLGHIGDSRCYRFRDSQLQQITKDHSVHQEQVDAGLHDEGSELTPLFQNMLTRGLGTKETVSTEINRLKIAAGDIYLMCSDGLTDMVSDAGIASILLSADPLEEKSRQLIVAANEGGGRDNITVLLAQVSTTPDKKKLLRSAGQALHGAWKGMRRQ